MKNLQLLQQVILEGKRNTYRNLMKQLSKEEHEKFLVKWTPKNLTPDHWIEQLEFHINPQLEQELEEKIAEAESDFQMELRLEPGEMDGELGYPPNLTLKQKYYHVACLLSDHYDQDFEYQSWVYENDK